MYHITRMYIRTALAMIVDIPSDEIAKAPIFFPLDMLRNEITIGRGSSRIRMSVTKLTMALNAHRI